MNEQKSTSGSWEHPRWVICLGVSQTDPPQAKCLCRCNGTHDLCTRSCRKEFTRTRVNDSNTLFPAMAAGWWDTLRPRLVPGTGTSIFEKRCEQVLCMTSPVFVASCMTILFVWTMDMKPEGSDPFVGLMPYVQPQGETLWQNVFIGSILNFQTIHNLHQSLMSKC